ncbi:MAG: flagellar assembly protein [Mariprofundus sp.]|nr:flagellar assembly protein [Mariprofundus sp.]
MSNITPLSFPEAPATDQVASAFPFTSIDAAPISSAHSNNNRMQQLEGMLKEVQGRAEIIEKEAYDKAYLAGEKSGIVLGRKRGEQILEALQETLQETETSLAHIQQSFAEAALDVAKHIAESIVGDIIDSDPARLLKIAQQAAAQLPDSSGLRIAVSADDFSSFKRLFEKESSLINLHRDSSVANGTCRVISNQQDILIDPLAAIDSYLNSLRPTLLKPSPSNSDAEAS